MRVSLHARLFLVAAVAIVAALGAASLFTRQAARMEFRRFELMQGAERLAGAARVLSSRLAREGPPAAVDPVLEELGRSQGRELVLVSPGGRVLGATSPDLRNARVTQYPDGRLEIEHEADRGTVRVHMRAIVQGGASARVNRRDGSVLGTLVILPQRRGLGPGPGAPFGGNYDLRLLLGAGAAGLVALALTWILSHRLLKPVQALTRAAGRLGQGDLSQRVAVGSSDELGELSTAFNAMAVSLARAENLRRTLVTDVAHELRSPLTNLRCQIESMEDGLIETGPETIHSLREEVLLLSRLVDDLQTLSIAEAGKLALQRAPVRLGDLVDDALESFRALASERGVALRQDVPGLPEVNVDASRIGQVLRNLLTNAMANVPPGGAIDVVARREDGGRQVAVSVMDNGPGIPEEHLPHIFERFYRADPSRARATGGAGLGLAIVKGIVEAHGGSVGAGVAPGGGARIRITLPVA